MASIATYSPMDGLEELTEKERETLRLIVRGHDAKSMASELALSVHTINERLRVARRKLGVTSSREAARLLLESEGSGHENLADKELGEAGALHRVPDPVAPHAGVGKNRPYRLLMTGAVIMSIFVAVLALAMNPGAGADETAASAQAQASEAQAAARAWLAFVDAGDWKASYAATAGSFRQANTLKLWSDTAQSVQRDLGATVSRQFIGEDDVPSPQGFTIVKFRTDFANKSGAIETLSLVREDGAWRVAGIYVS